jgi:hypothetical protein
VSKTVPKRRFISFCRVVSSRSGSQRTIAIAVPPMIDEQYCVGQQYEI